MTSQVEGWALISLLNISLVGPKVPSSLKTTKHENFSFWYHKQNPHTEINQLPVTTKILSQLGIQLCVAFVAHQSWQNFMGCMKDFLGLFNNQVSSELRAYIRFARYLKKYSSYITVQ
jgi:trehalose-6-phosphate synthase